jgi:protein SCO1/2
MTSKHTQFLIVLAAILLLTATLAACGSGDDGGETQPTATPKPGTILDPPKDVGDFTLTDQTGAPFHLSELRGKVVILYFGYTFCPDVCPMSLSHYLRVKKTLGDEADKLAVVFISVDGERDTPDRLAHYLSAFDPAFIGLTGTDTEIRTVAKDYGVFYQRATYDNTQADYLVDHTASTFVVGPEGRLRIIYPYGTDPAIMAEGVRGLIEEG